MKIVINPVVLPLAEIKLAPLECKVAPGIDQVWLHLARGQTAELRKKVRSSFSHRHGEARFVVTKIIERA